MGAKTEQFIIPEQGNAEYFPTWLKRVHEIGVQRRLWKEETKLDPKAWSAYYPRYMPDHAINEDLKHV